ncbi:MAG: pyridoxamine 5'-phosphate oxidase [Crocinitomicaceae bacterium]|nr:pyridoxamine 5'-phosphate oxidase [Crocinitomicaceae bacterium]
MGDTLDKYRDSHHEFTHDVSSVKGENPLDLFNEWFEIAAQGEDREVNAFVLGTSNSDNQPSSRIVYLKDILDKKFIFYSNYESQKGSEILANSKVSMLFFWPTLSRQIRIEGLCSHVAPEVSDAYFKSRPRGSKIGAWVSNQSSLLEDRAELEARLEEFNEKFGEEVPRPDNWGGFQIDATLFEFWSGRKSRLHDRLVFTKNDSSWDITRKYP